MKSAVRLDTIRQLIVETLAETLKSYEVPGACVRLGLQESVDSADASSAFNSKRLYVRKKIAEKGEQEIIDIAKLLVREYSAPELEDALNQLTDNSTYGVQGQAKNIIFASIGEKPDLIFRDAVNNDVEVVKNADKVLIFDRPLPPSGLLLWSDLEDWWMAQQFIGDRIEARKTLFIRLKQSVIAARSAGEYAIFSTYYAQFGKRLKERLPALLPQVYLHYDPYTRRERGDDIALLRQRMDFLLLLENKVRVVIEVDGRHHYAVETKDNPSVYIAKPKLYAEMVKEDRRLRLRGYEVYRFGGAEFPDVDLDTKQVGECSQHSIVSFFENLFDKLNYT